MRNGDRRLTNQDFCRQIRKEQPFLTTVRTNTVIITIATVRKYVLQQESNKWKQICQEKSRTGGSSQRLLHSRRGNSLQRCLCGVSAVAWSLISASPLRILQTCSLLSSAGTIPVCRLVSGRRNNPSFCRCGGCSVCHNHIIRLWLVGIWVALQSMLGAREGTLAGGRLGGQAVRRHGSGNFLVPVAILVLWGHFLQGADWPRGTTHDSRRDQSRCWLVQLWSPVLVWEVL